MPHGPNFRTTEGLHRTAAEPRGSMLTMRTVVLGPKPAELEAMIERRRTSGADLHDEVWQGEHHVAPAPAPHPAHAYLDQQLAEVLGPLARDAGLVSTGPFNLGRPDDYRVPDRAVHRHLPIEIWVPTAAVVVEILSPDDETWNKLDFYAAHHVDELLIVGAADRTVAWLALTDNGYASVDVSGLLGMSVEALSDQIDWPAIL